MKKSSVIAIFNISIVSKGRWLMTAIQMLDKLPQNLL